MPEIITHNPNPLVEYLCDKCGIGKVESIGSVLDMMPPLYPSKCNHCGLTGNLWECYPQRLTEKE